MYDIGCPRDYTADIHVITMVIRIRLWLFGIISAMLGLRMLQLLCRLPSLNDAGCRNTLKCPASTTFVIVMKLTSNLEETTVQGIDMKCFLIGSSVMCFCHLTF